MKNIFQTHLFRKRSALTFVFLAALWAVSVKTYAMTTNVVFQDFSFTPQSVTIQVGDTVVWTNAGGIHTVTGDGADPFCGPNPIPLTCSETFTNAGTFPYHCSFHQFLGMVGTVIVTSEITNPPPALLKIASFSLTPAGLALSLVGGTPPYLIQEKASLTDTNWSNVL